MSKVINHTKLSDTLSMTECSDGFWLYDYSRSRNISMRAKTPTDAFVEALTYYQGRLSEIERVYNALNSKVESFVSQFVEVTDET